MEWAEEVATRGFRPDIDSEWPEVVRCAGGGTTATLAPPSQAMATAGVDLQRLTRSVRPAAVRRSMIADCSNADPSARPAFQKLQVRVEHDT